MVFNAEDFLEVGRIALAKNEGDECPSVVLGRGISICGKSSMTHQSTHSPADSVRLAPWNNVMETRKVDRIAIGGWVTLCLLSANIDSRDEACISQNRQSRECNKHFPLFGASEILRYKEAETMYNERVDQRENRRVTKEGLGEGTNKCTKTKRQ